MTKKITCNDGNIIYNDGEQEHQIDKSVLFNALHQQAVHSEKDLSLENSLIGIHNKISRAINAPFIYSINDDYDLLFDFDDIESEDIDYSMNVKSIKTILFNLRNINIDDKYICNGFGFSNVLDEHSPIDLNLILDYHIKTNSVDDLVKKLNIDLSDEALYLSIDEPTKKSQKLKMK